MAFKLSKTEETQRADLITELQDAAADLQTALDAYNAELAEAGTTLTEAADAFNSVLAQANETLGEAVQAYNDKLADARAFCEQVAADAETEYDEKSDKWREGDRGSAAYDWKSEWENAQFNDIEIDYPEDVEITLPDEMSLDNDDHAETLEGLPSEAEG